MRVKNWLIVAIVAIAGCTERNPDFCGDKTCSDPAKPYCDYFGEIEGTPGTCIAVACTPGTLAACHHDTAITCNADGKNYEQVQCALGCDAAAGGCRQCTMNDQCTGGLVCDTPSSRCRQCREDDECDSRVCDIDGGTCVESARILYAAPNGASGTGALCSLAQPCAADQAIVTAANSPASPVVRLLPGTYIAPVKMDVLQQVVHVVATGATIAVVGDGAGIVVDSGATLKIRGIASTSERHLQCGVNSTTGPVSTVELLDATFTSPGAPMTGPATGIELQNCTATLNDVAVTPAGGNVIAALTGSTLSADRLRLWGGDFLIGGHDIRVRVTNSTLARTNVVALLNDTAGPGTSIEFAYDTIYNSNGIDVCTGTYPVGAVRRILENTIVVASGTFDALRNATSSSCSLASTILSHQATSLPGAIVGDPLLMDLGALDFRLNPASPAIDSATTGTIASDHDVDGKPRPNGQGADIGAYEFVH